ncbi:hypothetical protein [Laspinema olomoucense]|uniref:hypothetical protein n=1 Tax=Laspinema olomoucense TaxID=3231600 RepID=UPI0021BAE81D|nr:hypothetical protein [Laspinema sp. D3d]MCT7972372.1 hypothetical protein [Laspinema sp. D3d]
MISDGFGCIDSFREASRTTALEQGLGDRRSQIEGQINPNPLIPNRSPKKGSETPLHIPPTFAHDALTPFY